MKFKIILILICFSVKLNAQWHLLGDYNPIPGIPYEYTAGLITGGVSKASEDVYTWEVINGKIRDQDGNYTLSTINRDYMGLYNSPISVVWDCIGINEEAKLILKHDVWVGDVSWSIGVQPCNVAIANKEYEYNDNESGTYLTIINVQVKNNVTVNFNGYRSVRILPGFIAEQGSVVRIYNELPSAPSLFTRSSVTGINDEVKDNPELCQNIPNPASFMTSISFVIPEIRKSAYLQFYNMMGVLVLKIPITSIGQNSIDVNTTELINGVYMYSLIIDDCLIDTKRMVVAN